MKTTKTLITTLQAFAQANYENGMDTMVECWGDTEYDELLKDSKTLDAAKASMEELASVYREQQADAAYHSEQAIGPVAPVQGAALPTPVATALLALVNAKEPVEAATATASGTMYSITPKAKLIAPHLTLQRGCTVPVGAQWRNNGHKAPNTRAIVIETLAELGGTFTHDAAVAALKPLKDAALLGSGTPASYLRAFVKSGYLALEVA